MPTVTSIPGLVALIVVASAVGLFCQWLIRYFFRVKRQPWFADGPIRFYTSDLALFDGSNSDWPICVSLWGIVFNVSSHSTGPSFYAKGSPYSCLAGRDASVALAKMDLTDTVIADRNISALLPEEKSNLINWLLKLSTKYQVVGYLPDFQLAAPPVTASMMLDLDAFQKNIDAFLQSPTSQDPLVQPADKASAMSTAVPTPERPSLNKKSPASDITSMPADGTLPVGEECSNVCM